MGQYSNEKAMLQSDIIAKQNRLAGLELSKRNGDVPEELLNEGIANEKREIAELKAKLDAL